VADGTITALWRYPVKSMAGEALEAARVDWRGMGGDRTHAVLFDAKARRRPLTAREAAGLLAYRASYPSAPDDALDPAEPPVVQVAPPGEAPISWEDPALRRRLCEDFGRELHLTRALEGIQDLGQSLLLTVEASRAALEQELGAPVDLRRFRPNVHLALDGTPAWQELGWEGRSMRFEGGVELELLHPCERCAIPNRDPDTQERWPGLLRHLHARHATLFGINARVVRPGRIAVGAAVTIDG
jgi:uncharacterized protein YcbX